MSFEQTNLHVLHIPGQPLTSEAPCNRNSAASFYALQFANQKKSSDELVEIWQHRESPPRSHSRVEAHHSVLKVFHALLKVLCHFVINSSS
jgi:hypothetical protein